MAQVKQHKRTRKNGASVVRKHSRVTTKQKAKVKKVFDEWKAGKLHSGSKEGPEVTNHKQATAIALSEAGLSKRRKPTKK